MPFYSLEKHKHGVELHRGSAGTTTWEHCNKADFSFLVLDSYSNGCWLVEVNLGGICPTYKQTKASPIFSLCRH